MRYPTHSSSPWMQEEGFFDGATFAIGDLNAFRVTEEKIRLSRPPGNPIQVLLCLILFLAVKAPIDTFLAAGAAKNQTPTSIEQLFAKRLE